MSTVEIALNAFRIHGMCVDINTYRCLRADNCLPIFCHAFSDTYYSILYRGEWSVRWEAGCATIARLRGVGRPIGHASHDAMYDVL